MQHEIDSIDVFKMRKSSSKKKVLLARPTVHFQSLKQEMNLLGKARKNNLHTLFVRHLLTKKLLSFFP